MDKCNGKRIYPDKKSAITVANYRYSQDHVALRAYVCELDDHWHLTHINPYAEENNYKKKKWKN